MRTYSLLFTILMGTLSFAQNQFDSVYCVNNLNHLNNLFAQDTLAYDGYKSKKESLISLVANENDKNTLAVIYQEIDKYADSLSVLDSIRNEIMLDFKFYERNCLKGSHLSQNEIDSIFTFNDYQIASSKENLPEKQEKLSEEQETYLYFGKDKVISKNIFKDEKSIEALIFKQLLNSENETHFGNVKIPMNNEKIPLYIEIKSGQSKKNKKIELFDSLKFRKIDIQIKDAYFADVRVQLEYNGKLYWFENIIGVSVMNFSRLSAKNRFFAPLNFKRDTGKLDDDFYIYLSDVLEYTANIGNNYVPNELTLSLPENDVNGEKSNSKSRVVYEIRQDTSLDKVLELRTYTDFLALFGEESNGLVQLEGSAKFFVFPRTFQIGQSQIEILPSVRPNVNYSRFEQKGRFVDSESLSNNSLQILKKRFLNIGVDMNVFKFQSKKYPGKYAFYGKFGYNLTELKLYPLSDEKDNLKAFNYGFGLNASSKRFNNFGLNYKIELVFYDFKNLNSIDLEVPKFITTIQNEAEVFYHPNKNPNSAIFCRLRTFNHLGNGNNDAFYQFQFGYKFSVGARKVTSDE